MTLEQWLTRATKGLSKDSQAIVRAEILEHSEAACAEDDPGEALLALGDPAEVNREYRKALLTSEEARVLREGNWEARAVCRNAALRWLLLSMPGGALLAAAVSAARGHGDLARILLSGGLAMGILLGAPFLPIYTPMRAIAYRAAKWIALIGMMVFCTKAFGSNWWLFSVSFWPLLWSEWVRDSIRHKLPAKQWPKQLYL